MGPEARWKRRSSIMHADGARAAGMLMRLHLYTVQCALSAADDIILHEVPQRHLHRGRLAYWQQVSASESLAVPAHITTPLRTILCMGLHMQLRTVRRP